ncbi:hypothetical protein Ctob_013264, partial [Chrysochromulina tobinii]
MLVGDTLGIAPVRKKLDAGGERTTTAGGGRQKPPSSAPAATLPAEVTEPGAELGDDDVTWCVAWRLGDDGEVSTLGEPVLLPPPEPPPPLP